MEHIDLLYSGLIATALILSIWTALLVTAACIVFAPSVVAPSLTARVSNRIPPPSKVGVSPKFVTRSS
jgi:hypothetical protein